MKRFKLLCLALMAMFSLAAAVTSVAQAEESIEILPGVGTKFSFASKAGENTKLETLGGSKIECKKVTGSGETTSVQLGKVEFKFVECEEPALKVKCTGLGDTVTGSITVKEAEFHIRHLLPASEGANLAVLVKGIHFSCLGILFTVEGCVASMDILTLAGVSAVNLLVLDVVVDFLQEKGDQKPISIDTESGLAMENCELKTKKETAAAESSGQLGSGTLEKFEKGGVPVTILIDLKLTP